MVRNYFFFTLLLCLILILVHCSNASQPNVVIRISNMTKSMNQDAIRITKQAFIKFNGYSTKSRSSIAQYIRQTFDQLHQPSWQCILGKDFALSVTTQNEKRIILDLGKITVLIFKGKC